MYAVWDYDAMFTDAARAVAYLTAIERAVRPGSVVVEIGTGVGYFAVAACRAGARRVYAIEVNTAVELGERVAADNACADRITFIRGDSRRVNLPERGDVLLSDLRGVLPLHGEHIQTLADARRRLLRQGAALIPLRDTLWAAPSAAPADWQRDHVLPGGAPYGIDRSAVVERLRCDWYRCHLDAHALLADAREWAALEYATIESPNVAGRAAWTFAREGVADGVAVWFDADLGSGVSLSNAPSAPRALYGQAFFPFERALPVRAGDTLAVDFRAHLANGEYLWGWDTTLARAAAGEEQVSFRQSNLASRLVSLDSLRRLGPDHRPPRTASTAVWSTMIRLVDGSRTLGEIAAALRDAHPDVFADAAAALRFASTRLGSLEDEDDLTSPTIRSTD